jgi:hypothetical protein
VARLRRENAVLLQALHETGRARVAAELELASVAEQLRAAEPRAPPAAAAASAALAAATATGQRRGAGDAALEFVYFVQTYGGRQMSWYFR